MSKSIQPAQNQLMRAAVHNAIWHAEKVTEGIGLPECQKFRERIFRRHPLIASSLLAPSYLDIVRRHDYVQANRALLTIDQRLQRGDLLLSMDDDALRDWCENRARCAQRQRDRQGDETARRAARRLLKVYGIALPGLLDDDPTNYIPALNRICDPAWWRRQVRKLRRRETDEIARDFRRVAKWREPYCSDVAVRTRRDDKRRNANTLSVLDATNEVGDTFSVSELAAKSVSAPDVRKAELMVRVRGFEEVADNRGHVGEFYTVTLPSRFHRFSDGDENPKYNGETVVQGQQKLVHTWALIRAKLDRLGIGVYGFRVAEPHHDGCPHWHFLLFMREQDRETVRQVFSHYALMESPNEQGASERRFVAVAIDKAKGSAAGYVVKYIAKNIDGDRVKEDELGFDATQAAIRVDAWSSTHSIRQFQQIGGPPVTVWRELRRIDGEEGGAFGEVVEAADAADWAAFVELMGGPTARRDDQPVRLATWIEFDPNTGEQLDPERTKYGDTAKGRVFGVLHNGIYYLTRPHRWVISFRSPGAALPSDAAGLLSACETPIWHGETPEEQPDNAVLHESTPVRTEPLLRTYGIGTSEAGL